VARALRERGELAAAATRLLAAHERARNLPLAHARLHLSLARLRWLQGERREALRELERASLAPVASGLRRVGGRRPEDPVEGGLWASAVRAAAVLAGRAQPPTEASMHSAWSSPTRSSGREG
jgi:hypothetical protein